MGHRSNFDVPLYHKKKTDINYLYIVYKIHNLIIHLIRQLILTSLSITKINFEIKYPLHLIQNAQPHNDN